MAYNNKQYNTRFSGRYNTPGQFVPAAESFGEPREPWDWPRKVFSYPLTGLKSCTSIPSII
uniref:SFRICE_010862 n=1 Tax=Spodoptera frugiperda TaxID=7108 RepID=A0A2H1VL80_SPOFR